jgi:hypothetical protein
MQTFEPGASVGQLESIASSVETAYEDNLNDNVSADYTLTQVEAQDLTSSTALAGYWRGSLAGGGSGEALPANVSADAQLHIAPRYRGGHPVLHLPPPPASQLGGARQFASTFVTAQNAALADFYAQINSITGEGSESMVWIVLRGYRPGAMPEAVSLWPVLATEARQYVGTMRRRARALR